MKVVHVATIDTGGAYKGALRLHESMQLYGIESKIIVRTKINEDSEVIEWNKNPIMKLCSKCKNVVNLFYKKGEIHGDRLGTDITKSVYVNNADIIFLHWVNSFLSMKEIEKISHMGKPVVWMLHDMWIFTGGCHADRKCGRYMQGCGSCPLLNSTKKSDLTHHNFEWKKRKVLSSRLRIIGPSRWIVECAQRSPILSGKQITVLPNTLNTKLFMPMYEREKIQKKYGIDSEKKLILFGAADEGTENTVKGFSFLLDSLNKLSSDEYALAIFGRTGKKNSELQRFQVHYFGYVKEEKKLQEIYNAADVFVNPSLQESFGYTVCEAMACGTPVVAFDIGGNKDQIIHKENGYLAAYKDSNDLAEGIIYCAENTAKLGEAAHRSAQKYSYEKIGQKYKEFCEEMLERKNTD